MIQPKIHELQEDAEINTKHEENLFNEIPVDFSNLERKIDIQMQETFRTPNRQSMDEGLTVAWVPPPN